MTTRYQEKHYEDVAQILSRRDYALHPETVAACRGIAIDFADLFAASGIS